MGRKNFYLATMAVSGVACAAFGMAAGGIEVPFLYESLSQTQNSVFAGSFGTFAALSLAFGLGLPNEDAKPASKGPQQGTQPGS